MIVFIVPPAPGTNLWLGHTERGSIACPKSASALSCICGRPGRACSCRARTVGCLWSRTGVRTWVRSGPGELDDVLRAGIAPNATNGVDRPLPVALLPEPWTGWTGTPGLAGHRAGRSWSPRLTVVAVRAAVAGGSVASGDVAPSRSERRTRRRRCGRRGCPGRGRGPCRAPRDRAHRPGGPARPCGGDEPARGALRRRQRLARASCAARRDRGARPRRPLGDGARPAAPRVRRRHPAA